VVSDAAQPIDRFSSRSGAPRAPGSRAMRTRERILDMTATLLREVRFKDLTTALVTQRLGLSPPAFYRYFADLNEALAECGEAMRSEVDALAAAVRDGSWRGRGATDAAARVVDEFVAFWSRHRALYRVIDLLADEGDARFIALRQHMFEPVTAALTTVTSDAGGRDPVITAGIVVATLVHVTAREPGFVASGIPRADLRRHLAQHVAGVVTGKPAR
jgi:AcrR family transcriptional regulator